MYNYLDILQKPETKLKNYKKILDLINGLILENKNIYNGLSNNVKNNLSFDLYFLNQFNTNKYNVLLGQKDPIFEHDLFTREFKQLIETLKNLLIIYVTLLTVSKRIDENKKNLRKQLFNINRYYNNL
jgi:hypothetical protein